MPANKSGLICPPFVEAQKVVRKDMADLYRNIRKDSPALARWFFKRQKWTQKVFEDHILYGKPLVVDKCQIP